MEIDRHWLFTWTTYGTWLPGDPRGSVTSVRVQAGARIEHDVPGTPYDGPMRGLHDSSAAKLKGPPIFLDLEQAKVLLTQFQETARYRGWRLRGVAIMANHIHIVFGVPGDPDPNAMMGDFKSYGSRALNRRWRKPKSETWWTGGSGSKRKLPNEDAVQAALNYLRNQHNPLLLWFLDDVP
jgi:REP element-mobilizing transposase RayT